MIQIATNSSQSARLKYCGLNPYTADMTLSDGCDLSAICYHHGVSSDKDEPAWSLSALLYALRNVRVLVTYLPDSKEWQALSGHPAPVYGAYSDNPIESCVRLVELLTDRGYKLNEIKQ